MIKPSPDSTPLIRVDNRSRFSHVYVAGIDIATALRGFSFIQTSDNVDSPIIHMDIEIEIPKLMKFLGKIPKEELEKAREIIEGYIEIYKDGYTDS